MIMATQETPKTRESASSELHIHGGAVHILVIEDDPQVAKMIESSIADAELVIDLALTAEEIEKKLADREYDVVLMDYVIPEIDAPDLLAKIRAKQADASVIVVTAFPSMDSAVTALRSHVFDYLSKPFKPDELKKALMRCLESRGLLRLSEDALREQVGAAIRERRKALGLTLAELAKRTNVSLGYLSQIELGKNSASIETLYRIALGLRLRVADLFQSVQSAL
jgi:DNA-binding NtrC family response regulator